MTDFALERAEMTPGRTAAGVHWQTLAIVAGLFILALIPRLTYDTLYTYDETNFWIDRTENFHAAISEGRWADTLVAYHPGVTTTWLSSAGLTVDRLLFGDDHREENRDAYVAVLRTPIALFHALCIGVAFLFLRRLLDARVALLGCLFWAVDPFIIGHSQIIHTDAPVMSLAVLTFLAALIAFKFDSDDDNEAQPVRWHWLVLSGVLGGLTVISKLNGVIVAVAIAGVVLFGRVLLAQDRRLMLVEAIKAGTAWGAVAALTGFLLMPVLWVDPIGAFSGSIVRAAGISLAGHDTFLFGEVYSHPPLHFLPVTLVMRLTPWAVIGFVVALFFILRQHRTRRQNLMLAFLLYIVVFVAIIATQPKKFDRYILPVYPLVNVIAAYGWVQMIGMIANRRGNMGLLQSSATRRAVWMTAGVALLLFTMAYSPYFLMYYNPLFGGIRTADDTVLVGWSEGLHEAAEFIIADSEDVCEVRVASHFADVLMFRHLPACTEVIGVERDAVNDFGAADYVVLYINEIQRRQATEPLIPQYMEHGNLLYTVDIHGATIVYVYEGTPPGTTAAQLR